MVYENKIANTIGMTDPSLLTWMPSWTQNVPMWRDSKIMAEDIIDELNRSEWLNVDDRVIFIKKLLIGSGRIAHGAQSFLIRELQMLDSPSFIQEKHIRLQTLSNFLNQMRRQMQIWVDGSIPTLGSLQGTGVLTHPLIDIYEEEGNIVITCALPALKMDKAFVGVVNQGTSLEVSGETPCDVKKTYFRKEIPTGKFKRIIQLPTRVDEESADAVMQDGLLTVKLKKANLTKIEVS